MNVIDLTIDDEPSIPELSPTNIPPPQFRPEFKKEEMPKPPPKAQPKFVKEYEWIEFDGENHEIDYVKAFQDRHTNDQFDFKALNLDRLDPNYNEPNCLRGNVIDRIMKSISKDGVIKTTKKVQDDYDVSDAFVDDTETLNPVMATVNQLTPAFDDFVCFNGDIDSFRKSNYFDKRLKTAKKHNYEAKKQKTKNVSRVGKKSGKEVSKKRTEENITRPPEELKKVKKTPPPTDLTQNNSAINEIP